ncbi:hypothetical protein BJX96DRAFT_157812 [Aspergillus floccosus]
MPPKPPPTDFPIHTFTTATELETFLETAHTTTPGFWVQLSKKSASSTPSLTAAEAVETALCFGWIDGRGKSHDDASWLMRFTPRRPRSLWSKKNVTTATRLIAEGRMRPAGLAQVEAAKADGRWDRAYDGVTVPADLAAALRAAPGAAEALEGMTKGERYRALLKVQMASERTRGRQVAALVEQLVPSQAQARAQTNPSEKRKRESGGERNLRSRRRKE